jgi:hypothetical protein
MSILWHRGWLVASMALSACSLLAPTDEALTGGGNDSASAGQFSNAGAEPVADAGAAASAGGGDVGASGTATSVGGGAGGNGSLAGGGGVSSSAGATAGGGTSTCVPDVTSTRPKASSLRDEFSDGTPEPTFRLDGDDACGVETKGRLHVALPAPVNASYYCYFETTSTYDLTCDAIVVKVPAVVGPSVGLQTFLYLTADPAHKLTILVEDGAYLVGLEGEKLSYSGRYSAAEPWWRLRETAASGKRVVVFETSADAQTWTERTRLDRPFGVGSVKIALGAGAWAANASPGISEFACYNAAGTCD